MLQSHSILRYSFHMQYFPKEQKIFTIPGSVGELEVMTTWPKDSAHPTVAIICHPNPTQLGTMHNKVVTTLAKSFDMLGFKTVRFNFRGVGKSAGEFGHVKGEIDDLLALIDWVERELPEHKLILSGFSFGSYIAAAVANQRNCSHLVSIAPPVDRLDFTSLTEVNCPWLVVMGDQDEVVLPAEVIEWANNPPSPINFILLKNVDHFFHGRLIELRELIINYFSEKN